MTRATVSSTASEQSSATTSVAVVALRSRPATRSKTAPYTTAIRGSDKYDLVLVAGRFRVACLLEALPFVAAGGTVFLQNAQRYLALHIDRNQLATPRRHLPHVTASYTLTPQGKMRIGKRNNAVLRKYYDVVAMEKAVVALRPKPLAASVNASWEEDLAAAWRDPC